MAIFFEQVHRINNIIAFNTLINYLPVSLVCFSYLFYFLYQVLPSLSKSGLDLLFTDAKNEEEDSGSDT